MLNGIFQRPYLNNNNNLVKKKQDDEKNAALSQREEQSGENAKSKGLQYLEQPTQPKTFQQNEQVDWRQMRSQIQAQVREQAQAQPNITNEIAPTKTLSGRSTVINIAQILKDFRNTAAAIGTPESLKEEVEGYLSLVQTQVTKENPNTKLVKSNLKNASTILDSYISQTLNKESKVVENWVDALFLQQVDYRYNESEINPQFLVKFPQGNEKAEQTEQKNVVAQTLPQESVEQNVKADTNTNTNNISPIPQDKELKSLFIQSKKFVYANQPEKAIETFEKAINRANEVGDKETKSKIYYEVGKIYDDHDYFAEALKSYHKSLENTEDNNIKTKAHYSMAQIYDDVNQIKPALNHYFSSVAYAGDSDNLVAQSTSLTKMGNIYTDMFDIQGIEYYDLAEDLAEQTDNSKVKGFVSSSIGNAYEIFGESHKALKAYSNAVKHYTDADSPLKTAQNYLKAGDIMVEFSNVDKAKSLLSKAQKYAQRTDNANLMNEINEKLNSLELLS